jgi:phosphatidylglycerol:prolipoprotein diacylglycerol transferase
LHPELFRLHFGTYDRPFYTYGACVVLGLAVGVLVAVARARRYGLGRFDELAVGLLGIAGGIAGAVGLYVIVHARDFLADPSLLRSPGLVFYGGVGGGAAAIALYCRKFGVPLASAGDAGAPGLALGHAVGRVGCLMGGCCYGRPCAAGFPLGVELHGALRHPVQLYEAAGLALLCVLLLALSPPLDRRRGALTACYLGGYALLRLATEGFRGDDLERGFVWPGVLSTSQAIAIAMLLIAAALGFSRRPQGA